MVLPSLVIGVLAALASPAHAASHAARTGSGRFALVLAGFAVCDVAVLMGIQRHLRTRSGPGGRLILGCCLALPLPFLLPALSVMATGWCSGALIGSSSGSIRAGALVLAGSICLVGAFTAIQAALELVVAWRRRDKLA